jgi:AraC-like DNA-binding protein
VHRTKGLIRRDEREMYRLVLAMRGRPVLTQDGRTVQLRPGEFAIYDWARPYDIAYNESVHLAIFSIPGSPPAGITAVSFASNDGTAALAAPLLRRVALDLDSYQPASALKLSGVVLDLVSAVVAERMDRLAPEDTLLTTVKVFIEQHLGDLTLAPATVAAAHHISLRYLHRLFAGEHLTVAAWIRHRRLERCRKDLADPLLHGHTVSSIAACWGLPDSAQFSRAFRAAYGMPPAEFRRSVHA